MQLMIHPLSLQSQCLTLEGAEVCIQEFVSMLEYMKPTLQSKRNVVYYDNALDNTNLELGQPFIATINKVDSELKRKWFIYRKNHFRNCCESEINVTIAGTPAISGNVAADLLRIQAGDAWLSFSGHMSLKTSQIQIQHSSTNQVVAHASILAHVQKLLPQYEPNSKHKKEDYLGPKGDLVSAMPLSDQAAGKLLLSAVQDGDDLVAFHEKRSEHYRFKLTYPNKKIYHGFRIKEVDIPAHVLKQL